MDDKINEQIDENYIAGRLDLIEEKDSIRIILWMNDPQNTTDVIIKKDYKGEDPKTRDLIIKKVIGVLNNIE